MQEKIGNIRWQILALLFFATTINYIDRQVIGLLKPYIERDLGWTEISFGYIVAAFQSAYAAGLLLSGIFLDKLGTKSGFSLAVSVWSIGGVLHAVAQSIFGFGVARFILGLGEAANFPISVKTVAEWFPQKERALATGIFNSGSNIGAIIAPIIVSFVTLAFGWRWAFIITGLLGFIWLIFWIVVYKVPQSHPKISKKELEHIMSGQEEICDKYSLKELLSFRQTHAICFARFMSDWVWWFFLFWAPDFLNKTQGVNLKETIVPLMVIYTSASFGGIAGGWLSGHFIKSGKTPDKSRKLAMFICACCVLPLIIVPYISNLWTVILLISLATASHQGWASNIFTITSDIFPKNAVGTITGFAGFMAAIGGIISAPIIGNILDVTGSYVLIFGMASSVYLAAWLIIMLMIPEIKPLSIIKKYY